MPQITIQYTTDKRLAPQAAKLRKWAQITLLDRADNAELTIRIIDPEESQALNAEFRGKAKPTNVLSFPSHLPNDMNDEINFLGDLAICAAVVNQEAAEQHKDHDAHWAHMVVHGIYHLLGYDHEDEEEADEMEALETETLKALGYKNPYE